MLEAVHFAPCAPDFQFCVATGVQDAFDLLAIVQFTLQIADNAGVAAIQPVGQPQQRGADIHFVAWGEPEDVARMALFLVSDESSWITGQFFVVDGGFTAV